MTVASAVSRITVAGNSSATSFAFPFKITSSSHLLVTKTTSAGITSTLTLGTHYSVSGVGSESGGSITYPLSGTALPTGDSLTMRRVVPLTQTTDLTNQGAFYAEVHENTFDRLTYIAQQLSDELTSLDAVVDGLIGDVPGALRAYSFVGDGGTVLFSLGVTLTGGVRSVLVAVDGVLQGIDTYAVSGTSLIFSEAPPYGAVIDVRAIGEAFSVTLADTSLVTATGTTTGRSLADHLGGEFNAAEFGVVGNGSTNVSVTLLAAMTAAATAGKPLHLSPGTYLILSRLNPPTGLTLIGDGQPEDVIIRYGTAVSSDAVRLENVHDIRIENITFDNGHDLGFPFGNPIEVNNSYNVVLKNIRILNPSDDSVRIHLGSHHVVLEDSIISDNTIDHGVIIDNASYVTVRRNEVSRNLGFGIFVTNGSHHIYIENNICEDNGIEGVAITYSAYIGRVTENFVKGSGDNGISVTGRKFVVVGNTCRQNHFHGIELFGDENTCTGNHCWNNGQIGNPGYAGVATYPGFGGTGSYNTIVGNSTGDDQTVKTQDYAVRLYNTTYTSWTNGGVITLSTTSIYQRHLLNIYVATTAGTMATGSEPVHTSGTVAGADTIAWKYIASTTSVIDFNSAYNFVSGNSNGGNKVSEFNLGTSTKFNTVHGADRVRLPALASTASFPYCEVISGTGTPEAVETGTNGSLFLRRNGTTGVTLYAMANASASSRQTTGWKPLALRDFGAEASRPDLTGGGSGLRGYAYWNDDIDHLQVWETAAWATLKAILTEARTTAGVLDITRARNTVSNATGGTYAVTLAAPTVALLGVDKDVTMIAGDGTNTVTLALTNVVGGAGATTATFDAAGETLSLRAIQTGASTYLWMVTKEYGVTLT